MTRPPCPHGAGPARACTMSPSEGGPCAASTALSCHSPPKGLPSSCVISGPGREPETAARLPRAHQLRRAESAGNTSDRVRAHCPFPGAPWACLSIWGLFSYRAARCFPFSSGNKGSARRGLPSPHAKVHEVLG